MSAEYRTVYFLPDLRNLEWKIPIAAYLIKGHVRDVVRAKLLPDNNCLGAPHARTLLDSILHELHEVHPDEIVSFFGEHVTIGPSTEIPLYITENTNESQWVENLLPKRYFDRDPKDKAPSGRQELRRKLGEAALRILGVDEYVEKTFRGNEIPGWLPPASVREMTTLSQWVFSEESKKVLFLEPFALEHRRDTEKDLKEVRETIHAWRDLIVRCSSKERGLETEFSAYLLSGGDPEQRQETITSLSYACHTVFDVEKLPEQARLKTHILRVYRPTPLFPDLGEPSSS